MANLEDYYKDLLNWEGVSSLELVHQWPVALVAAVESDLQTAVISSNIKGDSCSIVLGSSNQSIGNQVEKYTVNRLKNHTKFFEIAECRGAGYPDKTLVERSSSLKMPLEMKATSRWIPSDSNRRVLTSSSKKLRSEFLSPIYHLLLTVIYSPTETAATIDSLRLDFLEPSTVVSVRLEASVNHKILSQGAHHKVII